MFGGSEGDFSRQVGGISNFQKINALTCYFYASLFKRLYSSVIL